MSDDAVLAAVLWAMAYLTCAFFSALLFEVLTEKMLGKPWWRVHFMLALACIWPLPLGIVILAYAVFVAAFFLVKLPVVARAIRAAIAQRIEEELKER